MQNSRQVAFMSTACYWVLDQCRRVHVVHGHHGIQVIACGQIDGRSVFRLRTRPSEVSSGSATMNGVPALVPWHGKACWESVDAPGAGLAGGVGVVRVAVAGSEATVI